MTDRIPDLLVEQLLLGELPPEQAQQVQAQLEAAGDPRLEQLRASNEAALGDYPPDQIARRIQARIDALEPDTEAGFRWPLWATAGLLAAAAATILVLATRPDAEPPAAVDGERVAVVDPPYGERIKGDAAVVLERQRGTRAEPLLAGAAVSAGDTLQVSYRSGGWAHGVLVSVDGAGAVTLHFPDDASGDTALQNEAVLHAFELDDAPDFERFLFFTAKEPLDPSVIVDRVETLARGPLPDRIEPGPAEAVVDVPLVRQ